MTNVAMAISVRVPASVLAEIEKIAADERRTRANVIRLLLEDALRAREKGAGGTFGTAHQQTK